MQKNKKIIALTHVFVWFALFIIPYLLSYGESQEINRIAAHFWIPLAFSMLLFYINYYVLIDQFLFTKKTVLFVLLNTLLILIFIFLKDYIENTYFTELISKRLKDKLDDGPPIKMFFYVQAISYLAPLFFSIAVKTTNRWAKTEAERKEAANFKLQSELQHLHYQLQPHFFFNSLNNIYALVDISPDQAKKSIHSLSKLMRYMLYETNTELISLKKEIDFMKKYIDLMKLRVSDKTTITYNFPNEETGIQIAPLLFISLIENAFKHGVSASKESSILINLTYKNKTILFTIENDNLPKQTEDKSGSGIGLPNVQKRLELLYPNKNNFTTTIKDNRYLVNLEIETN